MTITLRCVTVSALVVTLVGCAQEGLENVGELGQASTASCLGSLDRRQLNGPIARGSGSGWLENQSGGVNTATSYVARCTTSFTMTAGHRHLVKSVGANNGGGVNPLSLRVQRWTGSSWSTARSGAGAGTSTELVDWIVDVFGTYRVCAVADDTSEGTGSDYIRLTSDASDPALCGPVGNRGWCFGASGSNCDGSSVGCSVKSNAKIDCPVTVGSELHDQCCAHNPGGDSCGGSGNPQGWPSDCRSENDHAYNDMGASRYHMKTFDPTEANYGDGWRAGSFDTSNDIATWPSFSSYDDRHRGRPTASSMKTPVGKPLWSVDAQNGWCTNASKYRVCGSAQGNFALCCDSSCGGCSCNFPYWQVTACK